MISKKIDSSDILQQLIPLGLTLVVLGILIAFLHASLLLFNQFPYGDRILLQIRWYDILVGVTIYLKTAIDFAIFMGRIMSIYPGWRARVALEIGSAFGNALGTIAVIGIWVVFKEVDILLAGMVFLASLVLFELAHGSLEYMVSWEGAGGVKRVVYLGLHRVLDTINRFSHPVLSKIIPDLGGKLKGKTGLLWWQLLFFSSSVPFILGLDDFAGYVPLFSVINVYGFSLGVFLAHTILNISLFLSPKRAIQAVKNETISFIGIIVFIGIALYGLYEVTRIIGHMV